MTPQDDDGRPVTALTGGTANPAPPFWRPILTLGVTQIIGFGSIYYAFGVLVAPMARDLEMGQPMAYGALSAALLLGALVAPMAGRAVDRYGARVMMAAGSLGSALAFLLLSQVGSGMALFGALTLVQAISALVLYDAAFAALAQGVGAARARRAITLMTLMGGFASTLFWPLSLWLVQQFGWRSTWAVFGALHLLVCLPLHLSLPRFGAPDPATTGAEPAFNPLPATLHSRAFALLAAGFALSWAVMSAFAAQWVPALTALGMSEASAVTAGALMGPAQVAARLIEMQFAANRHPMLGALAAMACLTLAMLVLWLAPAGFVAMALFAVLFGIGQGLATMVRGTVPLALFGPSGYAARLGKLASLRMLIAALAPFAMAGSLALMGPSVTVALAALLSLAALVAMAQVPWRVRG